MVQVISYTSRKKLLGMENVDEAETTSFQSSEKFPFNKSLIATYY